MARGRLISRTLGSSQKFAALVTAEPALAEFAQLLYPLLVVNADDYGRQSGDAFTVKHVVFPTSPRTEAEFERALWAMHAVFLITIYTDRHKVIAQIEDFEEHQPGLSKRTKSKFPEAPSREIPGAPVKFTGIPEIPGNSRPIELNRTELNRTEEKGTEENVRAQDEDGEEKTPSERAGDFCEWYADAHSRHVGVGYIGNPRKDYEAALQMVAVFSDTELCDAATFWFGQVDKFATSGTRTIPKFASRASDCVLQARKVAV